MMTTLFESNPDIIRSEKEREALLEGHSKDYCFKVIADEEWLWDMRYWQKKKRKDDFTKQEIIEQINKWLVDKKKNVWSYNCGHCLYCIGLLIDLKWATINEIAEVVIKNNKVKHQELAIKK